MKKAFLILLMALIGISIAFAAAGSTSGTLKPLSSAEDWPEDAKTSDTATLTYSLTTGSDPEDPDDPSVISTYNIGFSSNEVTSLSTTPSVVQSLTLEVGEDFIGKMTSDVYVYWQIASAVNSKISITPTSMAGLDSNKLHINFSTSLVGDSTIGQTAYSEENTGTTDDDNSSAEKDSTSLTKEIYAYDTDNTSSTNQAAGCQKISIVTNNIAGLTADTYTGTLTLKIEATV